MKSILDNDLYKFTMQQAVLEHYPNVVVNYRFKNRGSQKLGDRVVSRLQDEIQKFSDLSLSDSEYKYLQTLRFLKPQYLEWLKNSRLDPGDVSIFIDYQGEMQLDIRGYWKNTILWEVPLMALVSEIFFEECKVEVDPKQVKHLARAKAIALGEIPFAEFGTRRRRSYEVQRNVISELMEAQNFLGTSNVHFAQMYGLKPIGTMAHEWIMGVSALESLRHANRYALHKWKDTYKADLGIALTDTFGSKAFWKDFDLELAKVYDGIRHDSGNPVNFAKAALAHYRQLGIDPKSKSIIFSDGLNIEKANELYYQFLGQIKIAFGIGTHFTNDFVDDPALNMVIKLRKINNIPVVKLSDEPGKETGLDKAIEVAKWTFGRDG